MVQQLLSQLTGAFGRIAAFLPNLLSAILIFIVGYVLSRLAGTVTRRLLARAHFDQFVDRHLSLRATARRSASGTFGAGVFWIGMLVTFSMAANSLKLVTLSAGINRILGFVPQIIVAAIIVGIAAAIANVFASIVAGVAGGWLARFVRVAILGLAVFMALDQLGVARTVVTTTYSALLGAVAVAIAVAFGVGGIPVAREYSHRWARRSEDRLHERDLGERPVVSRPSRDEQRPGTPPSTTHTH